MKITFVTYHNWKTKRQGGFHKFAEASVNAGYETVFFSFSRPFFGIFKNSEILNYKVLLKLIFGKKYYNDSGNSIINFTWPTFALPNPVAKFLNDNQVVFFKNISIFPFKLYCKIFLKGTDVFVFESCDGLLLYDKIKKYFPNSKIIYRPSDPIQLTSDNKVIRELEKKIISEANLVMIVNKESKTLYSSIMNEFNNSKYIILPNGISINKFKLKHKTPIEMSKHKNRVTYVGAREPNWNLIIQSAKKLKDFNFFIVTPIIPNIKIKNQIECLTNAFFIPGIFPHEVPNWITNSDLIIVPYAENEYVKIPRGITVKYFQAIAAKKNIIAYHDTKELSKLNVVVSYTFDDFINQIRNKINSKFSLKMPLHVKDWSLIQSEFLEHILRLK